MYQLETRFARINKKVISTVYVRASLSHTIAGVCCHSPLIPTSALTNPQLLSTHASRRPLPRMPTLRDCTIYGVYTLYLRAGACGAIFYQVFCKSLYFNLYFGWIYVCIPKRLDPTYTAYDSQVLGKFT